MDFETAQKLFRAFDPQEPLRANHQRRYVERADSMAGQLQGHRRPGVKRFTRYRNSSW